MPARSPRQAPLAALAAGAALVALASPARAAVTLDFEGVTSYATVADYYAGGSDGAGANGPANLGVSFSGGALALSNDAVGTYFSNAPSGASVLFASDASAFLNVAAGFSGAVSFWYSSSVAAADAIQVYAGLDGSGAVLGSFSLAANAQNGCADTAFCHWDRVALNLGGTGRSIGFGANAGSVAFDNVTIAPVPEPATTALLALGLAGVALTVRRRAHPTR